MKKILLLDVEFSPGGKAYSFLTDEYDYDVGDLVVVPSGKNDTETTVRVVAKRQCDAGREPFPVDRMKRILRRANEDEVTNFIKTERQETKKVSAKENSERKIKERSTYVAEGLQPDGSFVFSYEDYGVDSFDGMDIETTYILDAENTEKLRLYLSKKYVGSLESMLAQECGQDYRKKAAIELFEEAGIKYKSSCWIS